MISRLFGNVSQKLPSLFHRVSLMMKPQVVFVLGGPGAGKGTQCSKIVEVRRMGKDKTIKATSFDGYFLTFFDARIIRGQIIMLLSFNIVPFTT